MTIPYRGFKVTEKVMDASNKAYLNGDDFNFFSQLLFMNAFVKIPEVVDLKEQLHLLGDEGRRQHAGNLLQALYRSYKGRYEPIKHQAIAALIHNLEANTAAGDADLMSGLNELALENDPIVTYLSKLTIAVMNDEQASIPFIEAEFQRAVIWQFGRDLMQGIVIVDEQHPKGVKLTIPSPDDGGTDATRNVMAFIDFLMKNYDVSKEEIFYIIYGFTQRGFSAFSDPFQNPDQGVYPIKFPGDPIISNPTGVVLRFKKGRIHKVSTALVWNRVDTVTEQREKLAISEISHTFPARAAGARGHDALPFPGMHLDRQVEFQFQSFGPAGDIAMPESLKVQNPIYVHRGRRFLHALKNNAVKMIIGATLGVLATVATAFAAPVVLPTLGILGIVGAGAGAGLFGSGAAVALSSLYNKLSRKPVSTLDIHERCQSQTIQTSTIDQSPSLPFVLSMGERVKFVELRHLILYLDPQCKTFNEDMLRSQVRDLDVPRLADLFLKASAGQIPGVSADTVEKAAKTVFSTTDETKLSQFMMRISLYKIQSNIKQAFEGKRLDRYLFGLSPDKLALAYLSAVMLQVDVDDAMHSLIKTVEDPANRSRLLMPMLKNIKPHLDALSTQDLIAALVRDSGYPMPGEEAYQVSDGFIAEKIYSNVALMQTIFAACDGPQLATVYLGRQFHGQELFHQDARLCERLLSVDDDDFLAMIYDDKRFLQALMDSTHSELRIAFLAKSKPVTASTDSIHLFIRALAHAINPLTEQEQSQYRKYFLQRSPELEQALKKQLARLTPKQIQHEALLRSKAMGVCDDFNIGMEYNPSKLTAEVDSSFFTPPSNDFESVEDLLHDNRRDGFLHQNEVQATV